MHYDLATQKDDAEIRRLLRESLMDGQIQVTLEREPNSALAATIEGDRHQTIVARDDAGGLLGMGSRSMLDAYVNGEQARVGYLGQLRVDARGRGRFGLIKGGYAKLRDLSGDGAAPFHVTTIIEDNTPARRFLEAGLRGFPTYRAVDRLVTVVLPVGRRQRRHGALDSHVVERGSSERLPQIVECLDRNARRYQFARCWTAADLTSNDRTRGLSLGAFYTVRRGMAIVGCLACWDQRSFKQSVVRGYRGWLRVLRPLIHRAFATLPPPGEALRSAFLSHVAIDDDDPQVLSALVAAALRDAAAGGIDYLMIGFSHRSPLLTVVREAFAHRAYPSIVYAVHWEDGAEAVQRLDGRPSHLEIAIL